MKPGLYRHYRGGLYRVLFTARDSTNGPDEGRELVVYISLSGEKAGQVYARTLVEFGATLNGMPGGMDRFTWVSE